MIADQEDQEVLVPFYERGIIAFRKMDPTKYVNRPNAEMIERIANRLALNPNMDKDKAILFARYIVNIPYSPQFFEATFNLQNAKITLHGNRLLNVLYLSRMDLHPTMVQILDKCVRAGGYDYYYFDNDGRQKYLSLNGSIQGRPAKMHFNSMALINKLKVLHYINLNYINKPNKRFYLMSIMDLNYNELVSTHVSDYNIGHKRGRGFTSPDFNPGQYLQVCRDNFEYSLRAMQNFKTKPAMNQSFTFYAPFHKADEKPTQVWDQKQQKMQNVWQSSMIIPQQVADKIASYAKKDNDMEIRVGGIPIPARANDLRIRIKEAFENPNTDLDIGDIEVVACASKGAKEAMNRSLQVATPNVIKMVDIIKALHGNFVYESRNKNNLDAQFPGPDDDKVYIGLPRYLDKLINQKRRYSIRYFFRDVQPGTPMKGQCENLILNVQDPGSAYTGGRSYNNQLAEIMMKFKYLNDTAFKWNGYMEEFLLDNAGLSFIYL